MNRPTLTPALSHRMGEVARSAGVGILPIRVYLCLFNGIVTG